MTLATTEDGIVVGVINLRESGRNWSLLRDMINQGDDDEDNHDDNDNILHIIHITDGETIQRNWTWTTLHH